MSFNKKNFIFIVVIYLQIEGYRFECQVKDKATNKLTDCQFPFKFKGKTHNTCIDYIDIKDGEKVPGKPWCSTKVRASDRKHIDGGSHYGNCDSSCPGGVGPDADGFYYIDDFILTEDQYQARYGNGSQALSGIRGSQYRWPNGVLYYQFDSSVNSRNRATLKRVEKRFNDDMKGCIEMREGKAPGGEYVKVTERGRGCSSYIGKYFRGGQPLTLTRGCWIDKIIVHEFIHAWGFNHEQTRNDRDNYVSIQWRNIQRGMEFNFKKETNSDTFGIPYDGLSVMHYEYMAFSINRQPTITSKINSIPSSRLGKSNWMTESDKNKLRAMYKCDGTNPPPPPPPPPSGECTAKGQKCIFPFKYKGQTYNSCTRVDSQLAWCALSVDRYGEVIPGEWADCDSNCDDKPGPTTKRPIITTRPTTRPTTKPVTGSCSVKEQGTGKNVPCQFPFKFKGKTVHGCITYIDIDANGETIPVSNGRPWCSTKVSGSDRQHVSGGGYYGDCGSSCPIEGSRSPLNSPNSSRSCKVKDKATERLVQCEFPFKFKGETYDGCIDFIDIKNGTKIPGAPWCSTKVMGSDREHVAGGSHYGDCGSTCPGY